MIAARGGGHDLRPCQHPVRALLYPTPYSALARYIGAPLRRSAPIPNKSALARIRAHWRMTGGEMNPAHLNSTLRARILAVLDASSVPMTGHEIAMATGAPYKSTIDALNKLHDYGKVRRTGAKFTACWSKAQASSNLEALHLLEQHFLRKLK